MKTILLMCVLSQVCSATRYTVPMLGHGSEGEQYSMDVTLQLINPGSSALNVTIETVDILENVSVSASDVYIYQLTRNKATHPVESIIKNSIFQVYSSDYFGLQVIKTSSNGHSEGYQAIPNENLGTEYYVSTLCAFGEYCQFVIGSTVKDLTQIYLDLPAEVDEIGFCNVGQRFLSNSSTTISLIYPKMLQIESTHDLTGTRIYTDKPVAVLAGSRTMLNATSVYHLVEQLVPVSDWGTEFYIRPVGTNTYGNIVHIIGRYRRTYVSMTGHPRVELTGPGQTIKRRIDINIETRIQASRIVQVVLYTGSNETITKPGMTMVPAVEHYRSSYELTCESMDTSDPSAVQVQLVAKIGVTGTGMPVGGATLHATVYEKYQFFEYAQSVGPSYKYLYSSNGVFSGITNCKGSAIFPFGVLTLQNTTCTTTEDAMNFADGIDNDCDGSIDEDFCFENKIFETTFSVNNGELSPSEIHTENITGWRTIKLRIQCCGDVKIELPVYSSSTNQMTGLFVISITKVSLAVYRCYPDCTDNSYTDTSTEQQDADCNTMTPYWISRTSDQLCVGIGSYPDSTCASTPTFNIPSSGDVSELRLHGLYNDATFIYDIYRPDCGILRSDWRCLDLVTNCWEYEDDLCTTYTEWAEINCRKFCGICSPDNVGKAFKINVPRGENTIEYFAVAANFQTAHVSIDYSKIFSFTDDTVMTKSGTAVTMKKTQTITVPNSRKVQTIYSDVDIQLFARINGYYGDLTIPVYPVDALGTEYMVVSFLSQVVCDVITLDGSTEIWKATKTQTVLMGTITTYGLLVLNGVDTVGTIIKSNKPVAVFCAHRESGIVYFWTQVAPLSSLGKTYIIPAFSVGATTNTVTTARIVTKRANTLVQISGDFQAIHVLNEPGDYIDQTLNLASNYTISANSPISIGLLYTDQNSGDASFVMLTPVENYGDNAVLLFPSSFTDQEVSIATYTGNNYTEFLTFTSDMLYSTERNSAYAMTVMSSGSRQLRQTTHLIKDLSLHDVCTVTKGTPGDGIDNDCDGLVDEEVNCFTGYGSRQEDYDQDGSFGEDCLNTNAVSPSISPPPIPSCNTVATTAAPVVNTSQPGCWVSSCKCNCEWTAALEAYENMSQYEKDKANWIKNEENKKMLEINTEVLSATVAEKESAEDDRTSSANIGYVGIVLLSLIASMIVFFDLTNVYRYIRKKQTEQAKEE